MPPLAELREQLPGLVGERVQSISEGWDSNVHVLDGTWVVRVPKLSEVAREVRAEIALLRELEPTLPVAVPRVEAVGPPDGGWFAYRLIDGVPMRPGVPAADVAAFLSALHRFPVERAVELGLRRPDWQASVAQRLDEFSSRVAPFLDRSDHAKAARRFAEFLDEPANFAFRPAVLHADLGPEHLLCAPNGRLVGVIDLLGPWYEALYGVDFDLPRYVESGLAGVRERLG